MKSFCIKTNNKNIICYLLKCLENSYIKDIYYINKKFKIYQNVIIHYKGKDIKEFYSYLTEIIEKCILYYYEPILIKHNLNYNYFYFDDVEKKAIKQYCYNYLQDENNYDLQKRKKEIYTSVIRIYF